MELSVWQRWMGLQYTIPHSPQRLQTLSISFHHNLHCEPKIVEKLIIMWMNLWKEEGRQLQLQTLRSWISCDLDSLSTHPHH